MRENFSVTGYSAVDEIVNRANNTPARIGHDLIKATGFEVWTGAGKTGTQLTLDTHFTLSVLDTKRTARAGFDIYTLFAVIDPTYYDTDLYLTYTYNGDYLSVENMRELFQDILPDFDPSLIPTAGQKAALPGTSGTPGDENPYVTDSDPRLPTADQKAALAGTEGTPSATNKYVTDEDGRLPTAGEKAALVGSYGTPGAVNRFITESDPVLSIVGGGGGTTGPDLIGIGQIGNGFPLTFGPHPALASLNSTDVAFIDETYKELRCYTFDGTNWTQKGNGLSITGTSDPALALLSSTDVAFIDGANDELRCYTFDGTNWTQKGSGLSITGASDPALASLNSTDVAFIDDGNNELRTYTFDGTDWTQKGSGLSIASVGNPYLASLNSTDVAYIDGDNDELRCYTFNGTNWTQKGSGLSIANVSFPALASLNSTDVAFIDSTNDELRCYTFDGTNWTQKGNGLSITASTGTPALAGLNSTDVAFIDFGTDELRTYNFLFGYDSASINIVSDYEVPELTTGKSIVIRRTSAYDGDPVTITPPSGATFEGLASLSLYGQYSFVELERISSTVFAIKDLDDSHSITPTLSFAGSSTGVVYTTQTGTVTCRRGRCSGELRLAISNKGTATGVVEINLLGCPVASGSSNKTAFSVLQAGITYSGYLGAFVVYGTKKLNIAQITEAGVLQVITDASVANSMTIFLSFEYPT